MSEWIFEGKKVSNPPVFAGGFVYKIENLSNGKFYIGKKSLQSVTNPTISKKKYDELKAKGVPVIKKRDGKFKVKGLVQPTNWMTYNGSCIELLNDIKNGDKIRKEILRWCSSRELTYRELEAIVLHKCLDNCDCYNANILSKFFKFQECG